MILIDEVKGYIDFPMKMTKEQAISKVMAACFVTDPMIAMELAGRNIAVVAKTLKEEEEE